MSQLMLARRNVPSVLQIYELHLELNSLSRLELAVSAFQLATIIEGQACVEEEKVRYGQYDD